MEHQRILLDIETQRDFLAPGGTCYSPASDAAAKNVYRLFDWARKERLNVISTLLRVRPHEKGPLTDRPHCVDGTDGERKLSRTVLSSHVDLGLRQTTDLPADLFDRYQQVIFEKRNTDLLRHPRAERLFTEMPPATFVVCGVGVAGGIVEATVGLRSRGFGVIVASDAVLELGEPLEEMAWRRMEAKGAVFARTAEIVAPQPKEPVKAYRRAEPARCR